MIIWNYNGTCAVDSRSISNLFADYFRTAFNVSAINGNCNSSNNFDHINSFDYLHNINVFISIDDVRVAIDRCKNNYTSGPDGIPSVVLNHNVLIVWLFHYRFYLIDQWIFMFFLIYGKNHLLFHYVQEG